jgi:hypothetical protein
MMGSVTHYPAIFGTGTLLSPLRYRGRRRHRLFFASHRQNNRRRNDENPLSCIMQFFHLSSSWILHNSTTIAFIAWRTVMICQQNFFKADENFNKPEILPAIRQNYLYIKETQDPLAKP